MSTQLEITRLTQARNKIRTKLVELSLAESSSKLDVLATAIEDIANNGAVTAEVKEGETYTIPKGYHNGSGTVSGVAGGGNYALQSKTVTPTKKQQNITPDAGSYGLSDVTVEPIPDNYQDVTAVTAAAADVLATKTIVDATGAVVAGTMVNNGAVAKTLDVATTSYTVPKGYHNGTGKVQIVTETKTTTPTESAQTISATSGKVLSSVTVNPIPENYIATDNATASAENILSGKVAYGTDGDGKAIEIEGAMPDNGAVSPAALTAGGSYTIPAGYHNGSGKVTAASLSSQTSATATAAQILDGETAWVNGTKVEGTMPNHTEGVDVTLHNSFYEYIIPEGYHSGEHKVSINVESKQVTPTKSAQTITPTAGKVITNVQVAAIPDAYQDVTSVTATAADVLVEKTIVAADGTVIEGTMANNGDVSATMDGLTTTSVTIPAGYTSGGTVSLTSDIEEALAAI